MAAEDDLDALLDATPLQLDEQTEELDLDALLDELTVSDAAAAAAAANGTAAPAKSKSKNKKGKGKKSKGKASAAFVSSKKQLVGLAAGEPPSFLDAEGTALWQEVMATPEPCAAAKQPPFSRAYRSFTIKGEGVNVFVGSAVDAAGAAAKTADVEKSTSSNSVDEHGRAGAALEKKAAKRLYQTTLGNAVAAAGTIEPTMSSAANVAMKSRLTNLYLRQLAQDLKNTVKSSSDFDAERFPAIAAKIMV
eukprot:5810-Heterococcus_DN1.PRE.3